MVAPQQVPITVFQGNDPALTFTLRYAGTTDPYVLTGSVISMYLKASPATADPTAQYTTTGGDITIDDGPGGVFSVQMDGADLSVAGQLFYHIDVEKSGKTETVAYGYVKVVDV